MARIYDNIDIQFNQGLKDIITNLGVNRVDFCVGYFNLRGWSLVENEIDLLQGDYVYEDGQTPFRTCRLLIGMQRPAEELIEELYSNDENFVDSEYVLRCKRKIAEDFKRQLLLGVPTSADESTLKHLSQQLKEGKVTVKLYLKEPLHAKLYLAHRPSDSFNPILSIMGSSNLTYSGLTREGELNAEFADSDSAHKLSNWFEDRWNDRYSLDITDVLINAIDTSWASSQVVPPYFIYLKTAYHLSQDAREGISGYTLPVEFKGKLFDFQEAAVKMIAKKLSDDNKRGAMIGDVVGLGKTITACAISKIFELNYAARTLIICPANLQEMWAGYVRDYDLKADVQSVAQHIDIEDSKYYKLIIIDESHNLRNSEGKRYRNIKALIEHLDSKVLLLTATPYNKDYSDLSNQLRLFISEDQDLGVRPEKYISTLGGELQFQLEHADVFSRSIKAFEKSPFPEDWSDLMKQFLVRRTRTFIKDNYAKTDSSNGRKYLLLNDGTKSYFPTRIPRAVKFKTEEGDQFSRFHSADVVDIITDLSLPRYGLSKYLANDAVRNASETEQRVLDNLSRAGQQMMGFCKSTFFKRLDSSCYSFLLSLYRHILRNSVFLYAIENSLPFPIGDDNLLKENYGDDNDYNDIFDYVEGEEFTVGRTLSLPLNLNTYKQRAESYYNAVVDRDNVDWISSSYFSPKLKDALEDDCQKLMKVLSICGSWNTDNDEKLNELERLLNDTHASDKVLVFTQYADTANYIKKQLQARGLQSIACVTGDSDNPTGLATRFSPKSNKASIPQDKQLRVLIATDVLSEGQNLQDSHIIVNFDLPWAIIRLIQRAGRVDRIGQTAEEIQCYSFFPADGVENLINLRGRLNQRINESAHVIGSDEVFFEGNEQNLRDMFNEKSGTLDDVDDFDVDLSSKAYQIWKDATDANPDLKRIIPSLSNVIYSTKSAVDGQPKGVITYAKTKSDYDVLSWLDKDGNIISQSQSKILEAMRCSINEPALEILDYHHEVVAQSIKAISEERTSFGGILGNKNSVKYRIVALINKQIDLLQAQPADDGIVSQLKLAIDDLYNLPMLESSKFIIGRMLKTAPASEIVSTILEMRASGNLCHSAEENYIRKHASIICSMGLR
jgi:superfamily II DNA or RNA helicase